MCKPGERTPARVALALAHSHACVAAFASPSELSASAITTATAAPPPPVLIGFARTVSDGQFVSLIADVAVLPSHQRRGVGASMLRRLLRAAAPTPSAFAAFPPPHARGFFAAAGFRRNPRYLWLRLRRRDDGDEARNAALPAPDGAEADAVDADGSTAERDVAVAMKSFLL